MSNLMENSILPKSDQVNADWFISGPQTYEIERVAGNESNKEQPVNVWLRGVNVPYRPSKSMRRVLVAVLGADASKYAGHKITLFNNPEIRFGGVQCGGIQISHMTGLEKSTTLMLTSSRSKKSPFTVKPLVETKTENEKPSVSEPQPDEATVLRAASDAARNGRDAFNAWWKDNAALREIVKPHIEDLKLLVEEKEADAKPS